jgi:hypothetical protein
MCRSQVPEQTRARSSPARNTGRHRFNRKLDVLKVNVSARQTAPSSRWFDVRRYILGAIGQCGAFGPRVTAVASQAAVS